MAKTAFKSVDAYIAAQPAEARPILQRVRGAIRKALPAAEEVVSYQIAAYRLPAGLVLFFAGWKRHYSLYPASERLVAAFENELAPYEVKGATIQFPFSKPVPVGLIGRMAKFRAKEAAARTRVKPARPKKRA